MSDVEITIKVLGKEMTRKEAEALYRELGEKLNMKPVVVERLLPEKGPYTSPAPMRPTWLGRNYFPPDTITCGAH